LTVFVDTSALFGLMDEDATEHARLSAAFASLAEERLVTHNYVIVECAALVARRLGRHLVRRLVLEILGPIEVDWIDEAIHRAALSAHISAGASAPSLVDFTSFEVMRRHGIRTALAVDRDFALAGFDVIPA
jgi:predicted nucleic acid-binding protein